MIAQVKLDLNTSLSANAENNELNKSVMYAFENLNQTD